MLDPTPIVLLIGIQLLIGLVRGIF
jgi:hypothetical protein